MSSQEVVTTKPSPSAAHVVETDALSVNDLLLQVDKIHQAMTQAMRQGVHYGVIPGTPKPTLLKPGAEKLCKLFHLRPHYEEVGSVHRDNLIAYRYRCVLTHFPSGMEISEGLGSCNSREKKYRRQDPWDIDNTIVKMAAKRALVAAILVGTAASDVFTGDPPPKSKNELHGILNAKAQDFDDRLPRDDGVSWVDWTREQAQARYGVESRADCTEEQLAELIHALDGEAIPF